jgi:hypothetical protein
MKFAAVWQISAQSSKSFMCGGSGVLAALCEAVGQSL